MISQEISDLLEDFLRKCLEDAASGRLTADKSLPVDERWAKSDAAFEAKHAAWRKLHAACVAADRDWYKPESPLYHIASAKGPIFGMLKAATDVWMKGRR